MGRQTNFFLTPRDQTELEAKLRSVAELAIVERRCPAPSPTMLESLAIQKMGAERLTVDLVRPLDLAKLRFYYLDKIKMYVIDERRSPVIAFTRCYYDSKVLKRGRIYYVENYFQGTALVQKDPEFIKWARLIQRATQRFFQERRVGLAFYGREADELRRTGFLFEDS